MHFVGRIFVDVIVTMFFIGLAGSAVVIIISFVEDFRELVGSDEPGHDQESAPHAAATKAHPVRAEAR
jgi:hypothetical protein